MSELLSASTRPLTTGLRRDLARRGIYLHVYYRGEDVTLRCRFADDRPGLVCAELYRVDAQGHKCIDPSTRDVMLEWVHADLEIREGASLVTADACGSDRARCWTALRERMCRGIVWRCISRDGADGAEELYCVARGHRGQCHRIPSGRTIKVSLQ